MRRRHRQIFWCCRAYLDKFSYWSKFHANIFTHSGVMTRNPGIGNTTVWVLPNIWRMGPVMDAKFGNCISNEKLLNSAKYQDYSFYRFWVIKGKPKGVKIPPPRLGLNQSFNAIQLSVPFHIETSHSICTANQMTVFYIKFNIRLIWIQVGRIICFSKSKLVSGYVSTTIVWPKLSIQWFLYCTVNFQTNKTEFCVLKICFESNSNKL